MSYLAGTGPSPEAVAIHRLASQGQLSLDAMQPYLNSPAASEDDFATFSVAWSLRRYPDTDVLALEPDDVLGLDVTEGGKRTLAVLQCQYLRIGFKNHELLRYVESYRRQWPSNRWLLALHGFALLGIDSEDERGTELVARALEGEPHIQIAAISMLALRTRVYDSAEQMVAIAEPFMADIEVLWVRTASVSTQTIMLHRSQALRVLAEKSRDLSSALSFLREAEKSIGIALRYVRSTANSAPIIQEYVFERQLVQEARARVTQQWQLWDEERRTYQARIQDLEDRFEKKVAESQRRIDDSVVRVVEVLGVFLALVAFAFSGAHAIFGSVPQKFSGELWQRAFLLVAAGTGALLFIFALRVIVSGRGRNTCPPDDDANHARSPSRRLAIRLPHGRVERSLGPRAGALRRRS